MAEERADVAKAEASSAESDGGRIVAALQAACVELGYDENHERRKLPKRLLVDVQAGERFPQDIMQFVKDKTRANKEKNDGALRPQLSEVIASFSAAIEHEEALRAKIALLKAKKARKLKEEEANVQVKLQGMGMCPAGFVWHRKSSGRRCNGGSHFVNGLPS